MLKSYQIQCTVKSPTFILLAPAPLDQEPPAALNIVSSSPAMYYIKTSASEPDLIVPHGESRNTIPVRRFMCPHRSVANIVSELLPLAAGFDHKCASEQVEAARHAAGIIGSHLPELPFWLRAFESPQTDLGIIKGLITGEEPASCPVAGLISLALASFYGEPFQYATQNAGALVGRLEPKAGAVANTGEGSGNFGLHCDDAALPEEFRVRHIQLVGVNNDARAATTVVRMDELMPAVPARIREVLAQPRFRTRFPKSFGLRHEVWSEAMALVENHDGIWMGALPSYASKPVDENDDEALAALHDFIRIAEGFVSEIVIEPGMVVIFNNSRIMHGRAPFAGRRLVLRTLVRPDLNDLRDATGTAGHVFPVWPLLDESRPRPSRTNR